MTATVPPLQTRDQRFAVSVLAHIQRVNTKDDDYKGKYGGMAMKLPILIRTAGLAQALAFVAARDKQGSETTPNLDLLRDLAVVLGMKDSAELAAKSRTAQLRHYMTLTREALAALLWFKRYTQSILNVEPTE